MTRSWALPVLLLSACFPDTTLPDDIGERTPCTSDDDCPAGHVCPGVTEGQLATCLPQSAPACGNQQTDPGEQCDDGNLVSGDGCSQQCTLEECGNGVTDPGEACDDGNLNSGDGCRSDCTKIEVCGDGEIDDGEACDDGNDTETDACRSSCIANVCGDGVRHDGVEGCDDGNTIDGDGCAGDCSKLESCGDGEVDEGEECDDGDADDNDACLSTCFDNVCGDGLVNVGVEACDDGNTDSAQDGCTSTCELDVDYTCPTEGAPCVEATAGLEGPVSVTLPVTIEHALHPAGDEDCYAFDVAGDETLVVTVSDGALGCVLPTTLTLYVNAGADTWGFIAESSPDLSSSAGRRGCTFLLEDVTPGSYGVCVVVEEELAAGDVTIPRLTTEIRSFDPTRCGDGNADPGELCDDGDADFNNGCTNYCEPDPDYDCPAAGACTALEQTVFPYPELALPIEVEHTHRGVVDADCVAISVDAPTHLFISDETSDGLCPFEMGVVLTEVLQSGLREDVFTELSESGCPAIDRNVTAGDYLLCTYQPGRNSVSVLMTLRVEERAFTCGDGTVDPGEGCDDGAQIPGDGCSEACTAEPDWYCGDAGCRYEGEPGDGATVTLPVSLPHQLGGFETDCFTFVVDDPVSLFAATGDGNGGCAGPTWLTLTDEALGQQIAYDANSGPGECSYLERALPAGTYSVCVQGEEPFPFVNVTTLDTGPAAVCGDGAIGLGEDCDDGATADGDGCSSSCEYEGLEASSAVPFDIGSGAFFDFELFPADDEDCVSFELTSTTAVGLAPQDDCSARVEHSIYPDMSPERDNPIVRSIGCQSYPTVILPPGTYRYCAQLTGSPLFDRRTALSTYGECGDGAVEFPESCDDGANVAGDGCSPVCSLEGLSSPLPVTLPYSFQLLPPAGSDACFTFEVDVDSVLTSSEDFAPTFALYDDAQSELYSGPLWPRPSFVVPPADYTACFTSDLYLRTLGLSSTPVSTFAPIALDTPITGPRGECYRFNAPADDVVRFEARSSASDCNTIVRVFAPGTVAPAKEQQGGSNYCGEVVLRVQSGATYLACVDEVFLPTVELEVFSVCGNGFTDPEEECDDMNNLDNDGCSAVCLNEP